MYAWTKQDVKNAEQFHIAVHLTGAIVEIVVSFVHHAGYQCVQNVKIFPIAHHAKLHTVENVISYCNEYGDFSTS